LRKNYPQSFQIPRNFTKLAPVIKRNASSLLFSANTKWSRLNTDENASLRFSLYRQLVSVVLRQPAYQSVSYHAIYENKKQKEALWHRGQFAGLVRSGYESKSSPILVICLGKAFSPTGSMNWCHLRPGVNVLFAATWDGV
jgi:hypothetical protein